MHILNESQEVTQPDSNPDKDEKGELLSCCIENIQRLINDRIYFFLALGSMRSPRGKRVTCPICKRTHIARMEG